MTYEDDYSFARVHMLPDEFILWKGKPSPKRPLSINELYLIPSSLLWFGVAAFWEVSAIILGAPYFFLIFGAVFVCIGLYLVFGRFLYATIMRKRTYYIITNKKIIRLRGKRVDMLTTSTMPPAHTIIHKNGNGTIQFGMPDPILARNYRNIYASTGLETGVFSLENIADIAQVQQAIDSMEK